MHILWEKGKREKKTQIWFTLIYSNPIDIRDGLTTRDFSWLLQVFLWFCPLQCRRNSCGAWNLGHMHQCSALGSFGLWIHAIQWSNMENWNISTSNKKLFLSKKKNNTHLFTRCYIYLDRSTCSCSRTAATSKHDFAQTVASSSRAYLVAL